MGAPIYQNAASYGYSGQGNLGVEKESTAKPGTIEAISAERKAKEAAEKKRLNTKTKDTEAKTVKQGRLSRKEAVKTAKNEAKGKRDNKINALGKYQENLPEGIRRKKEARTTKRQEMQDIRNEERGARREDRANRRIKKLGDRNNLTVGEATKSYNARQEALGNFKKGERAPNPANDKKQNELDLRKESDLRKNEQARLDALKTPPPQYGYTSTSGIAEDSGSQKLVSGMDMLDAPTQQAASEDSGGMGTYMLDSKNRRGR